MFVTKKHQKVQYDLKSELFYLQFLTVELQRLVDDDSFVTFQAKMLKRFKNVLLFFVLHKMLRQDVWWRQVELLEVFPLAAFFKNSVFWCFIE